jgi:hypothetical protein
VRAATYLLAAWLVVSLPAALILGAMIGGGNDEAPAPEEDDAEASEAEQILLNARESIVPDSDWDEHYASGEYDAEAIMAQWDDDPSPYSGTYSED